MQDHEALERARQLHRALTEAGICYRGGTSYDMLVSPDADVWSVRMDQLAREQGPTVWDWMDRCNQLYLQAVADPSIYNAWILRTVENDLPPEACVWNRRFARLGLMPLLARGDYSSPGKLVEVQSRFNGMSYLAAVQRCSADLLPTNGDRPFAADFAGELAAAFKAATGMPEPTVLYLMPEKHHAAEAFLARAVSEYGVRMVVADSSAWPEAVVVRDGGVWLPDSLGGGRVHLILRRLLTVRHFAGHPVGEQLLTAVADGRVLMDPPPNVLFDGKASMAFPFDPASQGRFTAAHRGLFPETVLYQPDGEMPFRLLREVVGIPLAEGVTIEPTTWSEWINSTGKGTRRAVLKAADCGVQRAHGGAAVYRLMDTKARVQAVVAMAAADDAEGRPWVIQRYDPTTFPIRVATPELSGLLTFDGHARNMVVWARDPQTSVVRPIGAQGNYDAHWKVHARTAGRNPDGSIFGAVVMPVRVALH